MRTRFATLLSVVGVLSAGSAAALVNTQVLENAKHSSSAAGVTVPAVEDSPIIVEPTTSAASRTAPSEATAPHGAGLPDDNDVRPTPIGPAPTSTTAPVESTAPVDTPPPAAPVAAAPVAAAPVAAAPVASAPVARTSTFQVGDAGIVSVANSGTVLSMAGAKPAAGWQVIKAATIDALHVEVVFQSSTVKIQFKASLANGNVLTSVKASRIDTPPTSATSVPAPAPSSDTIAPGDDAATHPKPEENPPGGEDD